MVVADACVVTSGLGVLSYPWSICVGHGRGASADTDLLPALQEALRAGKRVETASWSGPATGFTALRVPGYRTWSHHLSRERFDLVQDTTDYLAKWSSLAAVRVAESALQVHGGIGFTWEADMHLYLKRAQLDSVSFGDARHHRTRLATILRDRVATGASIWPET